MPDGIAAPALEHGHADDPAADELRSDEAECLAAGAGLKPAAGTPDETYRLAEQAGFLLRRASQRHLAIFARSIPGLTPPQWAVLAALRELGASAQSRLGAAVAMDAATVKGVIDRLKGRGLVVLGGDGADRRRVVVRLSADGESLVERLAPVAARITSETLAPLNAREAKMLKRLLERLG